MVTFSQDRINSSFFAIGFIRENVSARFEEKIKQLGPTVKRLTLDGFGYLFFTTPFYIDVAENDQEVWIKIGHAHDFDGLLTTSDLLSNGWLNFSGVDFDKFQGSVTLIGFNKHHARCLISGNILSASNINYYHDRDILIASDNLKLKALFLVFSETYSKVIPHHPRVFLLQKYHSFLLFQVPPFVVYSAF